MTGVPLSSLLKDEQANLLALEQQLGERVIGQAPALSALAQRLRAAKTGLTDEKAPLGVFLLVGTSGVGKTETALALADSLFGGEKSLITLNLSEYQEAHTVSQLKGSPPGYVGYGTWCMVFYLLAALTGLSWSYEWYNHGLPATGFYLKSHGQTPHW